MSVVYRHSDKALKRLYKLAESRFQNLSLASWDEINVIRTVKTLYSELDREVRAELQDVAREAFADAQKEIIKLYPDKDKAFRGLDNLFVLSLLTRYDAQTDYRYDREWDRKRDRLAEAILSVAEANNQYHIINTNEMREILRRSLVLVERQMRSIADIVTDEARVDAFRQAGLEEVEWYTQEDERVCETCRERHGHIYPINQIPTKHPHCRCFVVPRIVP